MFYFEAEQETAADEDSVSHVGLLAAAQMEDAEGNVARMREDDAVFKATMFQLLRRQSVDRVDLQHVADTRSKYFLGFIDIFKTVSPGGAGLLTLSGGLGTPR